MYTDYQLLIEKGSDKLSDLVVTYLQKGYVPHGNPQLSQVYIDGKVRTLLGQAVVLPKVK